MDSLIYLFNLLVKYLKTSKQKGLYVSFILIIIGSFIAYSWGVVNPIVSEIKTKNKAYQDSIALVEKFEKTILMQKLDNINEKLDKLDQKIDKLEDRSWGKKR